MENKAISKMNKKELYQKCQEQQQEIQKLSLFQEDREDNLKDEYEKSEIKINNLERVVKLYDKLFIHSHSLEIENEKLKISIKEYQNEYHILEQSSINEKNNLASHNRKLSKEIKESEECDFRNKYHHANTRIIAGDNIINELQEENDTLKEELKKLIKIKLEELNFKLKKIELQKEN